jgi:hypothetical protein
MGIQPNRDSRRIGGYELCGLSSREPCITMPALGVECRPARRGPASSTRAAWFKRPQLGAVALVTAQAATMSPPGVGVGVLVFAARGMEGKAGHLLPPEVIVTAGDTRLRRFCGARGALEIVSGRVGPRARRCQPGRPASRSSV